MNFKLLEESNRPQASNMYRAGLLVVPAVLHRLPRTVTPLFNTANDWIKETLYVVLHPITSATPDVQCSPDVIHSVIKAYERASALCTSLDMRVLMCNIGNKRFRTVRNLSQKPDIMIMDKTLLSKGRITEQIQDYFGLGSEISVLGVTTGEQNVRQPRNDKEPKYYKSVCLGGTFDHLHNGHKVLLSQACLVSQGKVTVGVTVSETLKNKLLCELMQSTNDRIKSVQDFLDDVRPDIKCEVVPITDKYGPTIHRPEMDCLVVSQETLAGGHDVNAKRKQKGFPPMELEIVGILEDSHRDLDEEEAKISSSSGRRRLLAKLLRKRTPTSKLAPHPCIIGMTGGIASGKSSICQRMQALGAAVIDCDKLGHRVYEKGSETYRRVLQALGKDILGGSGEIDRRKLGAIVFSDPEKRKLLEGLVWPPMRQLALDEIDTYRKKGVAVVILDAAVLIEAGWDDMVHEVWVTILPQESAVQRLMQRDSLTEEEARKRVAAQISNEERVAYANVVLSTQWEAESTNRQVDKAWTLLQERLEPFPETNVHQHRA